MIVSALRERTQATAVKIAGEPVEMEFVILLIPERTRLEKILIPVRRIVGVPAGMVSAMILQEKTLPPAVKIVWELAGIIFAIFTITKVYLPVLKTAIVVMGYA